MKLESEKKPRQNRLDYDKDVVAKQVFHTSSVFKRWDNDYYHPIADWFYEAAFDTLLGQLQATPDETILDAGCGPGIHTARVARRGYNVQAVDISEPALERGRQLAVELDIEERTDFQQADLTQLPFGDDTFQAIFSWGVVIHIPAADQALRELARVLKPGGRLALFVTNSQAIDYRVLGLIQTLLLRKQPPREQSSLGSGCFYSDDLWVWRMSISGVTDLLASHGLRRIARLPGSLTELHTRIRGPLRRLFLHSNNFWYARRWTARPCVTNLLIFEKMRTFQ